MINPNVMYNQDHRTAKIISTILIIIIVLLPIESPVKEIIAWIVGIWAVNPLAHVVETVRKHPHRHDKI